MKCLRQKKTTQMFSEPVSKYQWQSKASWAAKLPSEKKNLTPNLASSSTIVFEEHSEKKHFKVQGCSFNVPIVY